MLYTAIYMLIALAKAIFHTQKCIYACQNPMKPRLHSISTIGVTVYSLRFPSGLTHFLSQEINLKNGTHKCWCFLKVATLITSCFCLVQPVRLVGYFRQRGVESTLCAHPTFPSGVQAFKFIESKSAIAFEFDVLSV